jgi:sodium pump decarboxylase gamma subunit
MIVSNVIGQGLILSVVGIGLTFLALGILILVMVLLDRFFRDEKKAGSDQIEPAEKVAIDSLSPDTVEEEVVAAIAVALAQLHCLELGQAGLGSTLEKAPSRWWQTGRAQQSPADALRINHWRKQR